MGPLVPEQVGGGPGGPPSPFLPPRDGTPPPPAPGQHAGRERQGAGTAAATSDPPAQATAGVGTQTPLINRRAPGTASGIAEAMRLAQEGLRAARAGESSRAMRGTPLHTDNPIFLGYTNRFLQQVSQRSAGQGEGLSERDPLQVSREGSIEGSRRELYEGRTAAWRN